MPSRGCENGGGHRGARLPRLPPPAPGTPPGPSPPSPGRVACPLPGTGSGPFSPSQGLSPAEPRWPSPPKGQGLSPPVLATPPLVPAATNPHEDARPVWAPEQPQNPGDTGGTVPPRCPSPLALPLSRVGPAVSPPATGTGSDQSLLATSVLVKTRVWAQGTRPRG